MKICKKCSIEKPITEFYSTKNTRDKKQGHCKDCQKVISKNWNKNNKERKYLKEVQLRYGISETEYFKKLYSQKHKCLICKEELTERPHVDHCHSTGKVRGLLCRCCNLLLGYSKDNQKILQNAIKYLETHNGN